MFDDRQPLDVYDANAPKLLQHGYHPIPIARYGSETKKRPVKWAPDVMRFFGFPNWNKSEPLMTTQPGANIGALMGKGVIALDFDDDDAALIISEAFPPSQVNKAGARAFTAFYRVDFDVPSQDFWNDDGELVLQVLSWGKQTILPPSVHADTGEPYRWTNGHSLYDTPIEDLPLLPRDYVERITGLGFKTERPGKVEHPGKIKRDHGEPPEGPHAELNAVAINNLDKWVPQLNIYKCRRIGRRYPTYEGVAQWRKGTTGKPLEQRSPNLKISSQGIKDFGDGCGYSPLDLVMAARGSSLAEAFCWLEEKLLPQKPDVEIRPGQDRQSAGGAGGRREGKRRRTSRCRRTREQWTRDRRGPQGGHLRSGAVSAEDREGDQTPGLGCI
jgi:hypothetical protein